METKIFHFAFRWVLRTSTHLLELPPISSLASLPSASSPSLVSSSTRSLSLSLFLSLWLCICMDRDEFWILVSLWNFIQQVDDFVSQTKTLAGHNLEPTPWHVFPLKAVDEEAQRSQAYKILQCSYFSCSYRSSDSSTTEQGRSGSSSSQISAQRCPDFFRYIHDDLEPWAKTGISEKHLMEAKQYAAFRMVIVSGRLYVDFYYACVQSRAMFTVWSMLQLLRRYPGMVPDVDVMFDCMDKPIVNRTEHASFPLPLFRYCTNEDHFDIPFPDWSFWGW